MEDWRYRILVSKANKRCKLSWTTVRDLLCLDCSVDHLRHRAYGMAAADAYNNNRDKEAQEAGRTNASLSEFEEQKAAIKREKMRLSDQKRELNKLLREWARAEHIQDTIKDAVYAAQSVIPTITPKNSATKNATEAALLLSDWHIGMTTSNMNNIFNESVAADRVSELTAKTIEYIRNHNVTKLHVYLLGDLVNGLIHVTTRINNEENVIKQTMYAAELIVNMLTEILHEVPVHIYCARGNHDRVSANKKESLAGESFFDLLPWYLKAKFALQTNLTIHTNKYDSEIIVNKILDHTIFAVHGHQDKPSTVVQNMTQLLHMFPDYIFMGHYHSSAEREVAGAEVIVNSSLCGQDDYATSLRRTSKPAQKLLIFNNQGLLCQYKINL